jgi:hypothetical protein
MRIAGPSLCEFGHDVYFTVLEFITQFMAG